MHDLFANCLSHWTVIYRCLINDTEFWCYMSKECDIAKVWHAPPNLRRAIKRSQELGHTGERPRSSRKRTITPLGTSSSSKNSSNEIRHCLCEKLPVKWPNNNFNASRTSSKGFNCSRLTTTVYVWKMLSTPSSRRTSELGENIVHGWKAIYHRTSPQLSERRELVRRGSLQSAIVTWTHRNGHLNKVPQSETDAGVVDVPFSRLHHIFGMAALLAGSQPYGLQHLVHFGGLGLCYPQKFGGSGAVVAARVESIVGRLVTAYGLEFLDAFDAVYWSRKRPGWSKFNMLLTKLFVIVTRWQKKLFH